MKSFNKFFLSYPGIFEPFKIKKGLTENEQDKRPIMPFDFLMFIEQLLLAQTRGLSHLALDLMIIYQSGLRFPSSYTMIPDAI